MSLYKRDKTWWIDFTTASGQRVRRSADTGDKLEAQELHDRLKAESWRVERLGERRRYTWDEAAAKWLEETSHKRTHHDDVLKLRWLEQYLGGKLLTEVTRDVVAAIGARKRSQASAATANRHLALIRAILRRACDEWEWLDKAPRVKLYKEPKRRVRWITPDQARTLLAELQEHQRDMVLFALATGLRQGNRPALVTGGSRTQDGMGTRRGCEERRRSARVAQRPGHRGPAAPARQASGACVHLSGKADPLAQHPRLAQRIEAGRDREFPLARPAPHLGQLASPARH